MATDLPNRPKRKDEEQTIIDPKDRVKSAQDKPDPRFEAARQKAEREAQVLAERADKPDEPAEADDDEATEVEADSAEKGTFSFNMTAGDAEEDQ